MGDKSWEGQVTLKNIFGNVKDTPDETEIEEDTVSSMIEASEIDDDWEDEDPATKEDVDLADHGMVMIKGFKDAYPGKKMLYKGKPTKAYFQFYLKKCSHEQFMKVDTTNLSSNFKLAYTKAITEHDPVKEEGLSTEEFERPMARGLKLYIKDGKHYNPMEALVALGATLNRMVEGRGDRRATMPDGTILEYVGSTKNGKSKIAKVHTYLLDNGFTFSQGK